MKSYIESFIFSFILNVLIFIILYIPFLTYGSTFVPSLITYNNENLIKYSLITGIIPTVFDMVKFHKAKKLRTITKDKNV